MKSHLIAIFLLLSANVFGQLHINIPFDSTSNQYAYIDVVSCDKTDSQLYDAAKLWSDSKGFKSELINNENPEIQILGHIDFSFYMKIGMIKMQYTATTTFILKIIFKDGRYRYVLSNMRVTQSSAGTTESLSLEQTIANYELSPVKKTYGPFLNNMCGTIDQSMKTLIGEMRIQISKVVKAEDW